MNVNPAEAQALLTIAAAKPRVPLMHGWIKAREAERAEAVDPFDPPVDIHFAGKPLTPFIFASPHSGRTYPQSFLVESRLDAIALRASEDAYIDQVFADAPRFGSTLVTARFPRAFLDANRDPLELDASMFEAPNPIPAASRTARVAAGLGVLPRIVAAGAEIYRRPLPFAEAERRIARLHRPYHDTLEALLADRRARFGGAVLLDCHSMPSASAQSEAGSVDVALGDRFGAACAPALTRYVEAYLIEQGYAVARNAPYAGGYSTERYGRPADGFHALQIEINRKLYLDERRVSLSSGFAGLRAHVRELAARLAEAPFERWFAPSD